MCHRGSSQKPFPLLHSGMSLAVPGIVSITLVPVPSPKSPVLPVLDLMDWTCIDTQEQEQPPTSRGTLKRPWKKTTDFFIYISATSFKRSRISPHLNSGQPCHKHTPELCRSATCLGEHGKHGLTVGFLFICSMCVGCVSGHMSVSAWGVGGVCARMCIGMLCWGVSERAPTAQVETRG